MEKTCEASIDDVMAGRLDDLNRLLNGERDEDLGPLEHYALSFDYVPPGTFDDQTEGYFRYQISWGGPSDEFRFFTFPSLRCHRIEFWFLNWFDGASRDCTNHPTAVQLWRWLETMGIVQQAHQASVATR